MGVEIILHKVYLLSLRVMLPYKLIHKSSIICFLVWLTFP